MKNFIFVIAYFLGANAIATDISADLISKERPVWINYSLDNMKSCTTLLEKTRTVKLKTLGGASVGGLIGYLSARQSLALRTSALQKELKVLEGILKSQGAQQTSLLEQQLVIQRYIGRVYASEAAFDDFIKQAKNLKLEPEALKEVEKNLKTVRAFRQRLQSAVDERPQYKQETIRSANKALAEGFAGQSPKGISDLGRAAHAAGEALSQVDKVLINATEALAAESLATKTAADQIKAKATSPFGKKAISAVATFLSATLGVTIAVALDYLFPTEMAPGTLARMMTEDVYLFSDKISSKEVCELLIRGSKEDKAIASKKISGIMSVYAKENKEDPPAQEDPPSFAI